jgi:hypothetical protein
MQVVRIASLDHKILHVSLHYYNGILVLFDGTIVSEIGPGAYNCSIVVSTFCLWYKFVDRLEKVPTQQSSYMFAERGRSTSRILLSPLTFPI